MCVYDRVGKGIGVRKTDKKSREKGEGLRGGVYEERLWMETIQGMD